MKIIENPGKETWKDLTRRPQLDREKLENAVRNIFDRVHAKGDAALIEFTEQFDRVKPDSLAVSERELVEAIRQVPGELKNAIVQAAENIRKFHATQRTASVKVETMPGVTCWRKEVAIGKVGIYVPGGTAPLFSTVLMLGIPANIAGCREVTVCTPPGKDGKINAAILFAAQLVGITRIFKVGGAQAIAALTYGTQSIGAVEKILGPGNQYVTLAKQLAYRLGTAIDLPAGPSELLVIADEYADPAFIAADLLSQAEHGSDSQVIAVTRDRSLPSKIQKEIEKQIAVLPRKNVAQQALLNALLIVFSSEDEIIGFVNEYAPEHLIINTTDCDALAEKIHNAGSVFLGPYSPESAGDYASGTNHTLPTGGFAKAYGGVSVQSFSKGITFQKITPQGLQNLGPIVETMALAEQLEGHAESISVRLKALS